MTFPTPAAARPARPWRLGMQAIIVLMSAALLVGCGTEPGTPSPAGSGIASGSAAATSASPAPTPTLAPTALPTPQYTNPADAELTGLIPTRVAGVKVHVPPIEEFAYTPGDVAEAYGELGARFTALQIAYVDEPRLSLYAMRVSPPDVTTRELEPYLPTAGRYVGIAGLVRRPWDFKTIGDRVAWVRPEDNATVLGTMIYTWAAGDYVFLMIGVDDGLNRAMFRSLPGESASPATPRASGSPAASESSSEPSESAGS